MAITVKVEELLSLGTFFLQHLISGSGYSVGKVFVQILTDAKVRSFG